MQTNQLPKCDQSQNETGCCPRFNPASWEGQDLHFRDKLFAKAKTRCLFHVPLNMSRVFTLMMKAIEDAHARDDEFAVLSRDLSPWTSEHLFAVTAEVPGVETVKLSGDYLTRVFEGPYSNMANWCKEMAAFAAAKGKRVERQYYFYTTCPKCAKHYGKNYVVGITEVSSCPNNSMASSPST